MESNNIIKRKITIKRILLFLLLLVTLALVLSHWIWVYSGSNQWELEMDENGIKVYTLKTPGSSLKKIRGITKVKYPLNHLVAANRGTNVEDCAEWIPGCASEQTIEAWNSEQSYFIHLWRVDWGFPLDSREFLLKVQFSQNPKNKEVLVEFIAKPDMAPDNQCCVRIKDMHNTWRYTPIENGEVEVEFTQNMDVGGFMPYFLFNYGAPNGMYAFLSYLPDLLDRDKYRSQRFDFIKEVEY